MLKSYFNVAIRNLLKSRVFSFINILGLAVGMAACLLIVQYISFELSYDNFYSNGENIYRIKHQRYQDGALAENIPITYSAVGPVLKSAFPQVVQQTRLYADEGMVSAAQPNGGLLAFNEQGIYYVEGSFLHMFSFLMVKGSTSALDKPNSVVITEKTAKKYFPNQDAIGKTITVQQQISGTNITAIVTGVCKDVPLNSHLQFNFLVSQDMQQGDWVNVGYYTYIQLAPAVNAKSFEAKLAPYVKKNIAALSKSNNESNTQGKSNLAGLSFTLQPLRDIHLYSNLPQELTPGVSGQLVWFLGFIAVLILTIAYVNYLNLTTAKVIERAKEVGIRKVLGSRRAQLIKQFLLESLVLNIVSLAAAIGITIVCMPWFSNLCGVEMHFTIWRNYLFAPAFAGLLLLGVLVSALYPALVLSAYKPVQILKGKFLQPGKGLTLRKALVVFQFTATVAFMVGTLIVYRQVSYMQTENKGMDMKQTLVVVAPKNVRANDEDAVTYAHRDTVFQQEVVRNAGVQSVTASSSIPGQSVGWTMRYTSHPLTGAEKSERVATMAIGGDFIRQFKMKMVAGDSLGLGAWRNHAPMMLNEAAVTLLGFKSPQDAIGKFIDTKNGSGRVFQNEVVGVTQNFHQSSLKEGFTPIVFCMNDPNSITHYEVKINSGNFQQTIAGIEKTYKAIYPASAFEYFFLDDFFNAQYKTEQHFGQVFSLFAGFAIFVACMGLFGLTFITIAQRVKEIGIRKVLGATVPNILALIAKDFVGLIIIASLIAVPLVYWAGRQWLQGYAFRIGLSWWLFALPLLAVFIIAFLTISQQAVKAATANPVKSLRSE